jgi:uncharacterized protein (DUF736 family)
LGRNWQCLGKKLPKGHGIGGEPFLSITIDDLSFEHPLVVFAFPQDDETWDITWRRRRGTSKSDAA